MFMSTVCLFVLLIRILLYSRWALMFLYAFVLFCSNKKESLEEDTKKRELSRAMDSSVESLFQISTHLSQKNEKESNSSDIADADSITRVRGQLGWKKYVGALRVTEIND